MSKYIRHITLDSGHSRDSYASEISPEALEFCKDLIAKMITEDTRIQMMDGTTISGVSTGKHLLATVWMDDAPLCTIAVAIHSKKGAELWQMLHKDQLTPLATRGDECPPEP